MGTKLSKLIRSLSMLCLAVWTLALSAYGQTPPAVAAEDTGPPGSAGPAVTAETATAPSAVAPDVRKPLKTVLRATDEPNIITVKFRDGLNVRLRNNELVSTNPALFTTSRPLFTELARGRWSRADVVPEEQMDQLRQRAEANLGRRLTDRNLQFYLVLPPGLDAARIIDRLNALDIVELARPVPRPVPPPYPPDCEPSQTNLFPAPLGMGVWGAWSNCNCFGTNIRVADVEYSFNPNHFDLPSVTVLDASATDPFTNANHGTAVLGELGALRNGWGITGISPAARLYFSGTYLSNSWQIDKAITTTLSTLSNGGIMVIEQQWPGPNNPNPTNDLGLVPVEWYKPAYDAIQLAVGNGIVVVEAAGNGYQNLDDPIYSTGNGNHWPFLQANNSGAIIVGAGASASGSDTESSRLDFSNYGSRVDLQGWGQNVWTTGYGDLYMVEGTNLFYTDRFDGTSAATPMVAGACVLIQSAYKAATGGVLSPRDIKNLLQRTGTPQTDGKNPASENIGPLPNITAALSPPPVIEIQQSPTNQPIEAGTDVTFTLVTTNRVFPAAYQWHFRRGGLAPWEAMPGQTGTNLWLPDVQEPHEGLYAVVSSNCAGCFTNVVGLWVNDTSPPVLCPDHNGYSAYLYSYLTEDCGVVVPNVCDEPWVTHCVTDNSHFFVLEQDPPPGLCTNCFPDVGFFWPGQGVFPWAVLVTATDRSGNKAEGLVWVGLFYDYPPRLVGATNITLAADTDCQARMPALHDYSGSVYIWAETCFSESDLQWMQTPEEGALLPLGRTIGQATCRDAAGRETTLPVTMEVVDLQPPTIACPSNRCVTISATTSNTVVEFSEPMAADNCGVVRVQCDPPSGSSFSPGTNRVVCTAFDARPNSNSCSFTIVVNRAPLAARDVLRAVANQAATIGTSELLANDEDADGDPLMVTAVSNISTNGGVVELGASTITYRPSPDFVGADEFTYSVSDGRGGSNTAAVAVTVLHENDPILYQISIGWLAPNEVVLVFQGVPGQVCRLQRSTDLRGWEEVQTGVVAANGLVEMRDSQPVPSGAFYRVTWPELDVDALLNLLLTK